MTKEMRKDSKMEIPSDIKINKFSLELQEEIKFKFQAFGDADLNSTGDELLYEVLCDLEDFLEKNGIMSKWKKEIRQWMIDRNVYVEITDKEMKDMLTLPRMAKKFDFQMGKKKYAFNKHYKNEDKVEIEMPEEPDNDQIEQTEEQKDFKSVVWNIYITDEETSVSVDALCAKLSLSRNKVVGRILKKYAIQLLKDDKELLSLLTH